MRAIARAKEHQVVFCGLEVLRLIGERLESQNEVDRQDIETVLSFMREIAHRCLDNTEDILHFAAKDEKIANHARARSVFGQLDNMVNDSACEEFASLCSLYVSLLATSIFEDRLCLSTLDCDPTALEQFYQWEHEVDELERAHGEILHRLETKYTSPHCI